MLLVRIKANDNVTCQILHFAQNTRGCLLSEKALKDIRVLPSNFPSAIMAAAQVQPASKAPKSACGCLKRLPPPPLPSHIPHPPTPDNITKLENFLRSFFAASAFNTCPHQPLPAMTGELMTVTLRPDAVPYAIHTPIPIPMYW